ncbi:MAG: aldehyde ferredoxin oxidoreductase N-terminal domain-containing protein, partial [Candidatus Bathyarchaeia archaeon]
MNGFAGKIARIDLTNRSVREERLDPEVARKHEGGRAFGAKVRLEELKPGIDPLGPDNKLIFVGGPTTGTVMPGQTRY